MLRAIIDNPYRILGLYANAMEYEVMEAAEKLLQSPTIKCETDFSIEGLPQPRRDPAAIASARQKALDESESACHKMFWFVKAQDGRGESELKAGNLKRAIDEWSYSSTNEHKHNLMIAYFLRESYSLGATKAYANLFNVNYRKDILRTSSQYPALMSKYKSFLYDEANAAPASYAEKTTWKRFIDDSILQGFKYTVSTKLRQGKEKIQTDEPKSYLDALSSLYTQRDDFWAAREFLGISNNQYRQITQGAIDTVQSWIEEYLQLSQDLFKYKNVYSYANFFSLFAPKSIQSAYLGLLGWNSQKAAELRLLPEDCASYNQIAKRIFSYYIIGNLSSDSYRDVIEATAPMFIELKNTAGDPDMCYRRIADFLALVGLSIIEEELKRPLTEQIVADGGSVICYIDRVIDSKLLRDDIHAKRNNLMNRLAELGLFPGDDKQFPNAMSKMHWDAALYFDEDKTFASYCTSLIGCQNYLKRFPNGKYVDEVKALIAKNEFKKNPKTEYKYGSTTKSPTSNTTTRPYSVTSQTTKNTNQSSTYSAKATSFDKKPLGIKSVIIFICVTLALELVAGFVFNTMALLIVGFILAVAYWFFALNPDKHVDKNASVLGFVFVAIQSITSIIGLLMVLQNGTNSSAESSLIHSALILGGSGIVMCLSRIIRKYIERHPGPSISANGRSPLFLGTGNGIGVLMVGDFERQPIDGHSVTANYTFLSLFLPILPLGCYNASMSGFSRKSHKQSTTTYSVSGSQPWRLIEIIQIYCWWYSFIGLAIGIIGVIASLCGSNFI